MVRGPDIVELFGYSSKDVGDVARRFTEKAWCPFLDSKCKKTNHDQSVVYGTCSVTNGVQRTTGSEVIICPQRLYFNEFEIFDQAIEVTWGRSIKKFVGSSVNSIRSNLNGVSEFVVGFGQGSGKEVQAASGKLSFDWIIQRYEVSKGRCVPIDFIGIEVQSIDTTGNYRDSWDAYYRARSSGRLPSQIPASAHGLNWANVHKRLIPQIIRKGSLLSNIDRCRGFFFLVPDAVFAKFSDVIGNIECKANSGRDVLSVLTFALGPPVQQGEIRSLVRKNVLHYGLNDVKTAFTDREDPHAVSLLDQAIKAAINI